MSNYEPHMTELQAAKQRALAAWGELTAQLLILASTVMWSGFVLTYLWMWFIVPAFNVPTISMAVGVGVMLTTRWVTRGANLPMKFANVEKPEIAVLVQTRRRTMRDDLILGFGVPTLVLVLGWLVQLGK